MRDFKGMKRQRGRSRSSGGKPQHNANRAFDSNGPEGIKVRGAAQSVYEKYQQLARDAQTSGDRVLAENYLQHAEHYFRLLRTIQPQRPLAEIIGRDQFASGYDLDFEDEPGSNQGDAEGGENPGEGEGRADGRPQEARPQEFRPNETRVGDERRRDDRQRDDRQRDDRQRDDRQRDDRQRDDRQRDDRQKDWRARDEGPSGERPRDDRSVEERSREGRRFEDRSPNERPREDRYRDERDRHQGDRSRDTRPATAAVRADRPRSDREETTATGDRTQSADPLAVVEPRGGSIRSNPAPKTASPILRADDGVVSHAPAFLNLRSPAPTRDPDLSETSGETGATGEVAKSGLSGRRRRVGAAAPPADES